MSGGYGGGTELARQSLLMVLMNYGLLVFGVTDYASTFTTAHYGTVVAREPPDDGTAAACRLLSKICRSGSPSTVRVDSKSNSWRSETTIFRRLRLRQAVSPLILLAKSRRTR